DGRRRGTTAEAAVLSKNNQNQVKTAARKRPASAPASEIAVHQVLEELLPSGTRLRVDLFVGDALRNRLEARAGLQHRLRLGIVPARVALFPECVELAVLDETGGGDQSLGASVDAADMAEQQVGRVDRLAAHLRVEIEAAGSDAALLEDEIKRRHEFGRVVGELIGVPARLIVVAIGVDRSQKPERGGERNLVLERVMREKRVADFDVELDLALEAEPAQEPGDGGDVEIILVLGRLLRLRFDQQHALEPDLVLVVDDQREEAAELLQFAGKIGVEQGLIALAAAPEHVIGAAELVRRVDGVLHLRSGIREHLRVGIGRRARHVARMAEEVGRAPQELHPGRLHLASEDIGHLGEVSSEFGEARALRNASLSWKVKNGKPRVENMSKATSALRRAAFMSAPSHGRSKVGAPNMSEPIQAKLCQ